MDGVNELEMLEEQEEEKRNARMRLEAAGGAPENGADRPKAHVRLHRLEREWARVVKRLHRAGGDGKN